MTFKDEQKQAEFEAFAAYYRLVAQRPHTSAKMSRLNQLDSIMRGDFPGALQELKSEQRKQVVERTAERKLGKQEGSALTRRGSLPVVKLPFPGSARYERLKAAGLLPSQQAAAQSGKLEAVKVVAGGEVPAFEVVKTKGKIVSAKQNEKGVIRSIEVEEKELAELGMDDYAKGLNMEDLRADTANVQLSTGATFDTDAGRTENDLVSDARELSAKELVERYGRDLIFEALVDAGENPDALAEKTGRQLANILKRIGA